MEGFGVVRMGNFDFKLRFWRRFRISFENGGYYKTKRKIEYSLPLPLFHQSTNRKWFDTTRPKHNHHIYNRHTGFSGHLIVRKNMVILY